MRQLPPMPIPGVSDPLIEWDPHDPPSWFGFRQWMMTNYGKDPGRAAGPVSGRTSGEINNYTRWCKHVYGSTKVAP